MNPFLQQLLGFCRRNPFAIGCSLLAVLLWIGNYFIWTRHKELAAGHETLQRSGEDMLWDPLESTCRHASLSIL